MGTPAEGAQFADWLRGVAPGTAEWFELGWMGLQDGLLPFEVVLDQLPTDATLRGRRVHFDFLPIQEGEELTRVLIVMTDVTAVLEREELEREPNESLRVFTAAMDDPRGIEEFVREASLLVQSFGPETAPVQGKRIVHTLKGNAGSFGLDSLTACCHAIELRLEQEGGGVTAEDVERLHAVWQDCLGKIRPFLDRGEGPANETTADLRGLLEAVRGEAPRPVLIEALSAWTQEPIEARLERMAGRARQLADRLGKRVEVRVEAPAALHVKADQLGPFWLALPHAIRNALDHGIESAEARRTVGKAEQGTLTLGAELEDGRLVLFVEDDGGGIDWASVQERARAVGLPHATRGELVDALCSDGLTTRAEVTEISGRGVGMAALAEATEALGGRISIESAPGKGARLVFPLPRATVLEVPDLSRWRPPAA